MACIPSCLLLACASALQTEEVEYRRKRWTVAGRGSGRGRRNDMLGIAEAIVEVLCSQMYGVNGRVSIHRLRRCSSMRRCRGCMTAARIYRAAVLGSSRLACALTCHNQVNYHPTLLTQLSQTGAHHLLLDPTTDEDFQTLPRKSHSPSSTAQRNRASPRST